MKLIFNYDGENRGIIADVFVRVGPNQSNCYKAGEQCVGEIIFKESNFRYTKFKTWLPRECANIIISTLKKYENTTYIVRVFNEFGRKLGPMKEVKENFNSALIREIKEQKLKITNSEPIFSL